jgi:alkanesulfonate monooxygenase SsuD/methylene tetrahydromethanopterin reductase-like flavin-dependent oxidoreductase (luciferase family)
MRIGYVLPMGEDTRPGVPASPNEIIAMARDVEAAGFDSVWTFDHLLQAEGDDGAVVGLWEGWTLLAAIAARTERAAIGCLVTCTGFRSPGMLAKMAHTVQEISDGRLVLGVGAGWHEPEYRAFGYPFDHKVDRFAEAMEIIGPMVREGSSTFSGTYYRTENAPMLPAPAVGREPMPILIGGRGPRMLGLIAQHADVWNTAWFGVPGPKFDEQRAAFRAACEQHGRNVEVSVGMYIKSDDATADAPGVAPTTEAIGEALAAWRDAGVDEVLCWADPPTAKRLEAIAAALPAARG